MGREHHRTNCAYRADPDEPCTCGVTERTERQMSAAWRKRAEEAETALAASQAEVKAAHDDARMWQSAHGEQGHELAKELADMRTALAAMTAERDELRKACQAALDTFMGIRVGGVIATEIMLRSALARAAVEGER